MIKVKSVVLTKKIFKTMGGSLMKGFQKLLLLTLTLFLFSLSACVSLHNEFLASCTDGIRNQNEEGVDCGGVCRSCYKAPTCSDGKQNQGEKGVDCGGPCRACKKAATCSDGIKNQNEEGVDCGGSCKSCLSQSEIIVNKVINECDLSGIEKYAYRDGINLSTSGHSAIRACYIKSGQYPKARYETGYASAEVVLNLTDSQLRQLYSNADARLDPNVTRSTDELYFWSVVYAMDAIDNKTEAETRFLLTIIYSLQQGSSDGVIQTF